MRRFLGKPLIAPKTVKVAEKPIAIDFKIFKQTAIPYQFLIAVHRYLGNAQDIEATLAWLQDEEEKPFGLARYDSAYVLHFQLSVLVYHRRLRRFFNWNYETECMQLIVFTNGEPAPTTAMQIVCSTPGGGLNYLEGIRHIGDTYGPSF